MAKCGGCGKFMSATADSIRCTKCPGSYHSICVGITAAAKVSSNWLCPGCKAKIPRVDNSATPVKSLSDDSTDVGAGAAPNTAVNRSPNSELSRTTTSAALDVAHEIRCFREELSEMKEELRQFRQVMTDLKADVSSCKERLDTVEIKVSNLEKRFEEREPESCDRIEDAIAELKMQLNERDQELLLNDVIITGIPETKEENPVHLLSLVSVKLGVTFDERDVVYAERVGMVRRNFTVTGSVDAAEPPRPRALAVRLARRAARDQLMRAARVRRGLTTADLELHGPSQRFYVNERLTPINGKLFFNAREAGQRHKYKYVWTRDGRIYVKKDDGFSSQRIRTDADLARIFGEECGEEIWETILRESGARNTVFSATQQYPDALMLRLACALSRLISKDPNSPSPSKPGSPLPRKPSLKSKPSWRSASVHTDNRTQSYKCPFTATNALKSVTKKEIDAYNSSEEIRPVVAASTGKLNETRIQEEAEVVAREFHRRSLGIKFENHKVKETTEEPIPESTQTEVPLSEPTSPESEGGKRNSILKPRKTSCTVALDVYKRRGSINPVRPRLNSLSVVSEDKLIYMREKFGTPEKVMHFFGRCFVKFFSYYGYDTMIRATGRYFCTFLQSVDNIHQRMRFTFPRMRSPSMQLTRAHRHGAELVYSSGRTGYTHYLMGQLYEIAEDIFSLKLKVSVVKESMEGSYYVAVLRLEFDNSDYVQSLMLRKSLPCPLPAVPASLLLQLFPFGVLLDRRMKILKAGERLVAAWGGPVNRIEKSAIAEILRLRKPKVAFTWDKVVCMQTMIFDLELLRYRARGGAEMRRGSQGARSILLRGPIYLLEEIDALIFLCSPIFNDLDELRQVGLSLADMNGHGLSKEMLLQGWQHLSRLELLFEKAESRSLSLEKSCRLLDQWKKRGDQLLYSMIPKGIADHLRAGKDPMAACQAFENVTIIFCGVAISEVGTRADVMQTVAYINDVYSRIDRLLDTHRVYKVETVGTVYMLVSGAPERRRAHAASAASAAIAISRAIPALTIGIHTGPVVAGVLGLRLPRYCLVGDTVNTASRMQTSSEPGRVQISAIAAAQLPAGRFRLRRRGVIKVKGKGMMETFWLEGEVEEEEQNEALQLFSALCGDN